MDIKILKNEELISLLDYTETILDAIVPDMLSLIPEDCMEVLIKNGDTQNLPHLAFIETNLYFIKALEQEMQDRALLKEFCSKKVFVNYETGTMFTYPCYSSRYGHLCYLKKCGFLDLDKVIKQTEKAKADYSKLLKEVERRNKRGMN